MPHIVLSDTYREYFQYLDDLRESGSTNMFGAPAFLERQFDLEYPEARQIVLDWMRTFSARHKCEHVLTEFDIDKPDATCEEMIGRLGTEVRPLGATKIRRGRS